jgi:hypothetical protein
MAKKQDLASRYDDNKETSFKQDAIVHMWIHKHRTHIHFHVDMHQCARGHVSTCSCIQMHVALDTWAAFGLYPMVHSAEYGYALRAYTQFDCTPWASGAKLPQSCTTRYSFKNLPHPLKEYLSKNGTLDKLHHQKAVPFILETHSSLEKNSFL